MGEQAIEQAIEQVVQQIRAYLVARPQAADTLEGMVDRLARPRGVAGGDAGRA